MSEHAFRPAANLALPASATRLSPVPLNSVERAQMVAAATAKIAELLMSFKLIIDPITTLGRHQSGWQECW